MEEKAVYMGDAFLSNFNDLFGWSVVLVASVLRQRFIIEEKSASMNLSLCGNYDLTLSLPMELTIRDL